MPIFDQGYQHWQGTLSGHAWRWLTITRHGVRVIMLTGDTKRSADAVARGVGITEVQAGVRPEAKGDAVRALRAAGRIVARTRNPRDARRDHHMAVSYSSAGR